MKILHIVQLNEKNSYNLFKALRKLDDGNKHVFFVCNYKRMVYAFPKFFEFNDFIYVDEKSSSLKKVISLLKLCITADHIILNSLIFNSKKYLYFFFFFNFLLRKATWIEWGADLYNWKINSKKIHDIFLNYINFYIRRKVKYIGVTFEGDENVVHSTIRKDVKCFFTPLIFGEGRLELLKSTKENICEKKDYIKVQVAHNSYPFNNHKNCLEYLKKYSSENINIILPISYGTYSINGVSGEKSYVKDIIYYAHSNFGKNKVTIMSKFLGLREYIKYLWSVDIAIFGSYRPIGLANIIYLLYMGKKVYLPGNSPQYKFFKSKNLNVHKIEDIEHLSFEEFIYNDNNNYNNCYVIERLTYGNDIKYWEKLFDYIKNE